MSGQNPHFDILTTVVAKLNTKKQNNAFPNLPNNGIVLGTLPRQDEELDPLPQILVAPAGSELQLGILTTTDDIGYPVATVIVARSNQDFKNNLEQFLTWRWVIFKAFRNQPLVVAGWNVFTCQAFPDVVIDPELFNHNYFYSGILFRFSNREQRG